MIRAGAVLLAAVLMPLGAESPGSAGTCLHFEPTVEWISGKLFKRTLAGPPEYQSIEKGDMPEVGYFVKLPKPICFYGTPGDELNSEDVSGVKVVQVAWRALRVGPADGGWAPFEKLLGKKVKAVGTFFTAHTAHHRTPVLLDVTSLERAR